jgi:hypothetical protein
MKVVQRLKSSVFHMLNTVVSQPLKTWFPSAPDTPTLETLLYELNDYLSSEDAFLKGVWAVYHCR